MSGHSRWSKVKHYKGTIDAKRGKIFAKLGKEMSVACKHGATSALEVSGRPHMPERLQGRPNGPGGLARVSLDKSDVGALCVGPPLRGRAPLLAHRKPTESNAT